MVHESYSIVYSRTVWATVEKGQSRGHSRDDMVPPGCVLVKQVGSNECLLSEIKLFGDNAGPDKAKLEVYEGMVHVFQFFLEFEPVALDALSAAAEFIQECSTRASVKAQVR